MTSGTMTNREAIDILRVINPPRENKRIFDKFMQARNMAIKALENQERETQEKPFPLVVGQPAEMYFNGKWEKGKIVAGYRFNDGVVTIETEDGRKLWCGQDRTDIYRPYQEDKE